MVKHTNQWILAIFSVLILGLIGWYIQNGISNRPVITYRFQDCPKEIGSEYYYDPQEQTVSLGLSNSGSTDALLILKFYGENITILNKTKKGYNQISESEVLFSFLSNKNNPSYYYGESVYFTVNKSVDSFSYSYVVYKGNDPSISGSINQFFGEIKPIYPIKCSYRRVLNEKFEKIE